MRSRILLVAAAIAVGVTCWPGSTGAVSWDQGRPEMGPQAKSLILFIGDGMGPEIVSLAKIYSDKVLGRDLNCALLANAGSVGMTTTYSSDRLVTDSAASGTALATGSKTNNGAVGIAPDGAVLENIFEKALRSGKAVGVVTTTSVTDATPASFLAHVSMRSQEVGIASQIVAGDATVVMGGGRVYFLPGELGRRTDGRNLLDEARAKGMDVVLDRESLRARQGNRVLGLFADDDLPFESERRDYETPSLSEMLTEALRLLTPDPDGFVLVVEGGRIDHAEHDNDISAALGEFFAFDEALGRAMEYQHSDSTLLIIVTADHDTGGPAITAGYAGYPGIDEAQNITDSASSPVKWFSGGHTCTMVPVFARGPGEGAFSGMRDNTDINYGIVSVLGL
jgi:alkaline phosphatase